MNWEKIISNRFYDHSKIHGKYLSLLSMLGMGVGCFAIIIAISVMNGFENIVHTKLKGFEGDIRIFDNTNNGSWQKLDGIKTIMPFMERKAVLESTDNMKVVSIKAIDEKRMASFYDFSLRGSLPSIGEVLIGQDLAYRLGKKVGGFILIYSPIDQIIGLSAPFKKRFLISGIFSTKILNYDDQLAFITLDDGKALFSRKKMIDGYDVKVKDNYSIVKLKEDINNSINSDISVLSWDDQNRSLVDAMRIERHATILVLCLIFLVSTFNLAVNLSLISVQKTREIGILRVMGASKSSIKKIIMKLGFKRAGLGAFLGLFIGLIIIMIQKQFAIIPLPTEVYFIDTLPMLIYLKDIILVSIMSFCFIFITSFFSGKKLSQIKIKEAIQWVK